jgi:hypothetical protein
MKQQELLPKENTIQVTVKTKVLKKKKSLETIQEVEDLEKKDAQCQQVTSTYKGKEDASGGNQCHQDDDSKSPRPITLSESVIPKTAKEESICRICMRKFRTIEHFRRHETLSQLHKDNVKKAGLVKERKDNSSSPKPTASFVHHEYEDRAKKRRRLCHEGRPTTSLLITVQQKQAVIRQTASPGLDVEVELKKVQDRLNMTANANLAGQANQRMGPGNSLWESLRGRRETQSTEAIRKEWDRIESLAASHDPKSYRQSTASPAESFGIGFKNNY